MYDFLVRLRDTDLACRVSKMFSGSLFNADNIILLCRSLFNADYIILLSRSVYCRDVINGFYVFYFYYIKNVF